MLLIISIVASILGVVKIIGTIIGVICAYWYSSTLKVCERPLSTHDKKALAKPLLIGGIAGLIVTICLITRSMYLSHTLWQAILSIGAYKILIVPVVGAVTYYYPSKRRRKMKRRAEFRKAHLKKAST